MLDALNERGLVDLSVTGAFLMLTVAGRALVATEQAVAS